MTTRPLPAPPVYPDDPGPWAGILEVLQRRGAGPGRRRAEPPNGLMLMPAPKTAADLVNAFLADRKVVLDKAVADGRLTQVTADTLLATMKTNVEQHVNSTWEPRGMGYRFNGQQSPNGDLRPAQCTGLGPRWSR